jgi:hypothetical protein
VLTLSKMVTHSYTTDTVKKMTRGRVTRSWPEV